MEELRSDVLNKWSGWIN